MAKAIIFDMDGVLYDSEPLHFEAEKATLIHFGYRITEQELKEYLGWREDLLWNALIARHNLKATAEEMTAFKKPLFTSLVRKFLGENPELQALLSRLRKKGLKLALASSSYGPLVADVLGRLGVSHLFDAIVSGEKVKRGKPAPDIFLLAASELGVSPADCVVVEDAPSGVEAAIAAGMHPVVLKGSVNKELGFPEAEKIITDLKELEELV